MCEKGVSVVMMYFPKQGDITEIIFKMCSSKQWKMLSKA